MFRNQIGMAVPKKDSFSFRVSFKISQAWDFDGNELKGALQADMVETQLKMMDLKMKANSKNMFHLSGKIDTFMATVLSRLDEMDRKMNRDEQKSDELGLSVIEWIVNDLQLSRKYANNFIENGFEEMGTIMDLSDEDFKEMGGVEKRGHRRKIMKSLQKMEESAVANKSEGMGPSYFHHK